MSRLDLSLAPIHTKLGEVVAALDKYPHLIKQARSQGSDLIIFPVLSLAGCIIQDLTSSVAHQPSVNKFMFRHLIDAGKEIDIPNTPVLQIC